MELGWEDRRAASCELLFSAALEHVTSEFKHGLPDQQEGTSVKAGAWNVFYLTVYSLDLELLFMFRPLYVDLSLLPWDQGCENMCTWAGLCQFHPFLCSSNASRKAPFANEALTLFRQHE